MVCISRVSTRGPFARFEFQIHLEHRRHPESAIAIVGDDDEDWRFVAFERVFVGGHDHRPAVGAQFLGAVLDERSALLIAAAIPPIVKSPTYVVGLGGQLATRTTRDRRHRVWCMCGKCGPSTTRTDTVSWSAISRLDSRAATSSTIFRSRRTRGGVVRRSDAARCHTVHQIPRHIGVRVAEEGDLVVHAQRVVAGDFVGSSVMRPSLWALAARQTSFSITAKLGRVTLGGA